MKNGKIMEKIVKGAIIGIGSLASVIVAMCVKSKDDPDMDEMINADFEEIPTEEAEVTEEVSE